MLRDPQPMKRRGGAVYPNYERRLMSFATLGVAEPLLRNLAAEGYTAPTPIQTAAIPAVLSGRDLVGIAQTGTGKTAAFALPILTNFVGSPKRPPVKSCRV